MSFYCYILTFKYDQFYNVSNFNYNFFFYLLKLKDKLHFKSYSLEDNKLKVTN